jgi:methionine-rich copper-binding protein CopC
MKRTLFLGLAVVFALLAATPVLAHGDIDSLHPEPESVRAKSPGHVMLKFTEAPTEDARVAVLDGCGDEMTDERYVQGRTFHVFLKKGQPGKWKVSYTVISAVDGHKTSGEYTFTVKGKRDCSEPEPQASETDEPAGNAGTPNPDLATTSDADDPGVPVVVIGVGVLALIGIAFLVRMGGAKG